MVMEMFKLTSKTTGHVFIAWNTDLATAKRWAARERVTGPVVLVDKSGRVVAERSYDNAGNAVFA